MVGATFLCAVMASVFMFTDDESGTEPTMRRTLLPPISSITIRKSGAVSPSSDRPVAYCKDFQLSYKEIREYIGKAAEVDEHDYFHMLDWSPCYASGEVVFTNGIKGIWAIQQYRAGSLKLSNGQTIYLYCPRCRAKGFPPADK
jgi:hypothetical protein